MTWIPTDELNALKNRIERVNKRAAKQGLEGGLVLEVGATEWLPQPRMVEALIPDAFKIQMTEVTLSGTAPSFQGWTFLAAITNDNGALVIRSAPGVEDIARDTVRPSECDHCGKVRRRSTTYLIEKDGERKQVGSSCIKDFFGHSVMLHSIFMDHLEGEYDFGANGWDITHVIALSLDCIDSHGFRRSQETNATRDLVTKELEFMHFANTSSYERAAKIVDWIKSSTDSSDYMENLRALAEAGIVSKRNLGLAVSAPVPHAKALEQEVTKDHAVVPAPEGKIRVVGSIIGGKESRSRFNDEVVRKLIVKDDRGFVVYVTMPASLTRWVNESMHYGEADWVPFVHGVLIQFTAELVRSDRDAAVAFAKRPSKVEFSDIHNAA